MATEHRERVGVKTRAQQGGINHDSLFEGCPRTLEIVITVRIIGHQL
jgi:hypothetical protein